MPGPWKWFRSTTRLFSQVISKTSHECQGCCLMGARSPKAPIVSYWCRWLNFCSRISPSGCLNMELSFWSVLWLQPQSIPDCKFVPSSAGLEKNPVHSSGTSIFSSWTTDFLSSLAPQAKTQLRPAVCRINFW